MLIEPQPDELRSVLQNGIKTFLPGQEALAEAFLKAAQAIEVFTVALKDIVTDTGLTSAESAGWRFLAFAGKEPIAADVIDPVDGRRPSVAALSRDKLIAVALFGWEKLRNNDDFRNRNARVRILRIPGMLTEAFWLTTGDGQQYIVPFLVPDPALKVMEVYTLEDFLAAAIPVAESFLSADDEDNVDPSVQAQ